MAESFKELQVRITSRDRQNRAAQRTRTRANESNEPTSLGIVETRATSLGIVQRA